jgi:hypothetical protein
MSAQLLDSLPIAAVIVLFAIITLVCYELGFRLGRRWQERMPGEQEGPTGVLVGALLGLMAFLLAMTMSLATERFDARRGLVLAEANAIGKTYLQADYLPQPAADEMRELLRVYLPLRIGSGDRTQVLANIARSDELQAQMWAIAAEVAQSGHSPDLVASFGESLTEVISLDQTRIVAGLYNRVPETILLILLAGSALALGMVGYNAGITGQRSVLSAVVLIVAPDAGRRPRPATGGIPPGQPAAAARRPTLDRPALALRAITRRHGSASAIGDACPAEAPSLDGHRRQAPRRGRAGRQPPRAPRRTRRGWRR